MKRITVFVLLALICWSTQVLAQITSQQLVGAWETLNRENRIVMICTDQYFSAAVYHAKTGAYAGTCGGTFSITDNKFNEVHEFNTMDASLIGKQIQSRIELKDNKLLFVDERDNKTWKRVDNGTPGKLAGAWLITGRMEGGDKLSTITPGARRTMKILSGTRFQWIAYNVETKEFFGTGGGTYSTVDGKYTEKIEFFSRDNGRVGKTLQFDFSLPEGNWRHKGLSSKGDPIDEVWTKREKIGL